LAIWVTFLPLAILNGAVRERLLTPMLGKQLALPLSGILLSGLLLIVTYILFPFLKASSRQQCWLIGSLWLILTVLFEFGFGHFIMRKPWQDLFEAYSMHQGNLWLLVLTTIFVLPYCTAKFRGIL
jgi:hypothetical protein